MSVIKVLLIDDDEDDFVLTKGIFDEISNRYSFSWVDSYEKGINAILKKQYEVYLVDYRLGKGTGIDLLTEAVNSGCEQPIIILTGKGDTTIDVQAMNIGAADYLIKDEIDSSSLDRSIRYAIKQAETLKALKFSESKYKAVFEQANDPILLSDQFGKIHDINNGGLKFFGYERTEFMKLKDAAVFKNLNDRVTFGELLEKNGALVNFECELISRQGIVSYCSLSSFIQTDMVNLSEVYHTIVRDLSYRRNMEERSVNLGKMSISAHIAKGLGEEIRDPLSTINLALDELASDNDITGNETIQSYIEIIKNNCDRVNQLMQNFISSTETKTLNLQRHNIVEVIEEAISDTEDLITGHSVRLIKELVPYEQMILLDKPKIKNVLVSIISNAVEAMQTYPMTITITGTIDKDVYRIAVADTGTGIEPQNREMIYEPFFTTKKRAGGLGLTHAQRVLTTHGGSMKFEPLANGSLFMIQIPIYHESTLWI
ncbi:MAG: response regulator [Pedobacter sp.]|nr:MAG: response regulator [Pedobacter sp.]